MTPDATPAAADPTSRAAPGLVAVVVTHDRPAKLAVTLRALLAHPAEVLRAVVVVDNASAAPTRDLLAACDDPRLTILTAPRNEGGAGGFHRGIAHARDALDPDWTVVMDDDARPEPGCLARFLAEDRGAHAAWAAAVYEPDGRICDMNRPVLNPFWRPKVMRATVRAVLRGGGREAFHLGGADYDADAPPSEADSGAFVGLFLSRRAVGMAGLPDPRLFIYGDDVLYSLTLRAAGGTIAMDPRLRFEHDFASVARAPGGERFTPIWKVYYNRRNLVLVYRRAAGRAFPLVALVILPKWFLQVRAYPDCRGLFLRLLTRAIGDGLRGRLDVPHDEVVAWTRDGP